MVDFSLKATLNIFLSLFASVYLKGLTNHLKNEYKRK